MHALLDIMKERSGGRLLKSDVVHGYAVVFPHMDYEGEPPPHSDKAIIFSRRHLLHMDEAICTAYKSWTDEYRSLNPEQYHIMLNDCLMPRFRMFRPIGPDIALISEKLLELTEHQAQVFEGLYIQDRVLVDGVAGSGKTFLAIQRALSFARCGKKTLFVCYNKELALWIRRQIENDPFAEEFKHLLKVINFHSLASELANLANMEFKPASGGSMDKVFWDEEVPDLLEQAVLSLELESEDVRYDALVVDEAQDFSLGWWYSLTESLLKDPDSPIYAFIDPNQSLRKEVNMPPIDFDARFRLTINCRNTRKIAAASASVLELDHAIYSKSPSGIHPRLLRAGTQQQQKGLILEELKRLIKKEGVSSDQIVIIGPSAKGKGSLADVVEVEGIPMITSAEVWQKGGGILVTTSRSFKGLEAEIVILYDLNTFGNLFNLKDLYVACTRAKVFLIAIVHGIDCRAVIEKALAASETES